MNELEAYGWKPVFQQQLYEYDESLVPVRVIEVQRTGLKVAPTQSDHAEITLGGRWFQMPPDERPTVGDWILIDAAKGSAEVLLQRQGAIKRLAPDGELQLIAANIDTGFVVTSANSDFNIARIERYLAALMEAEIQPVVVITKADLSEDTDQYRQQVEALGLSVFVEVVDAREAPQLQGVAAWCTPGQSIALLGSSGVGKSTLVNTLMGHEVQDTQAAREGDDKGRHTTTHRSLHMLPSGAVILDSPGMREFQLTDVDDGVGSVFHDVEQLAEDCRFNDCAHGQEPGCAVQAAIAAGELDERRLQSYFKLLREERFNTETIAERHARSREFAKQVKQSGARAKARRTGQ